MDYLKNFKGQVGAAAAAGKRVVIDRDIWLGGRHIQDQVVVHDGDNPGAPVYHMSISGQYDNNGNQLTNTEATLGWPPKDQPAPPPSSEDQDQVDALSPGGSASSDEPAPYIPPPEKPLQPEDEYCYCGCSPTPKESVVDHTPVRSGNGTTERTTTHVNGINYKNTLRDKNKVIDRRVATTSKNAVLSDRASDKPANYYDSSNPRDRRRYLVQPDDFGPDYINPNEGNSQVNGYNGVINTNDLTKFAGQYLSYSDTFNNLLKQFTPSGASRGVCQFQFTISTPNR